MASKKKDEDHDEGTSKITKRQISLYDAVAGRAGYEGFLTEQLPSRYRDTPSTSLTPIPPDEVIFRRKGAPVRYEEGDIYAADRHLKPHQKLPDSDLLKEIHAYTADFYSTAVTQERNLDFRSMDETALLAMGILMEEAAKQVIGKTGDLAFVEEEDDVNGAALGPGSEEAYWHAGRWKRRVIAKSATGKRV
jgi:hypothetical protein